ncbi:MAG: hypothetical protein Q8S13_06090 [Dehalococcoidia bacterium]|nr:hypothetical protein [Dehalococcoidia bacterium]
MADRSSAALFADIFEALASDKPLDRKALAERFWDKTGGYDFSPYQMDCDKALIKLGLATKCRRCKCIRYRDEDHDRDCEPTP